MQKKLELVELIQRSLRIKEDVRPLVKYLDMDESVLDCAGDERASAIKISNYLRQMGSNDVATLLRGGEGVSYDEIVLDVGEKLKAKVKKSYSIDENEAQILLKMFEDALERMTDEEKRSILMSMGVNEFTIPFGPLGVAVVQNLLRQFGGFSTYRVTVIVANMMSRSLLGSGLSFATNAALTRTVGTLLGPVGWIATGLWLALDLAGPAFRKTVPAVIHVALLRTILVNRITIGVVGDGSAGKDALIQAVFGINSQIDPIAGSTETALTYPLNKQGNAFVVNYPGFNDYREGVGKYTDDYLYHTDVFVMVVDINRGISGTDIRILRNLEKYDRKILICLNKVDLVRSEADLKKLKKAAEDRLKGPNVDERMIDAAFDPDPRLGKRVSGVRYVYDRIREKIEEEGKLVDAENFPPPPETL
jgi:small GTP-binding protein